MYYNSVSELVGKTPLLKLNEYMLKKGVFASIFAKLEYFNPAGSVKDRTAKFMIDDAEARGVLKKSGVIIEPTSGNTGIALAAIGVSRGYKVVIVMPDTMSAERRALVKAYGAELVLTPGQLGMKGAIARAEEIKNSSEGSVILGQFTNPANPRAHFCTTGPEISEALGGKADILVAGVGTGGTLSGAGAYLKSVNPAIKAYAVEPYESPVLSGGTAGAHGIQGIGAGFIPKTADTSVFDGILRVGTNEARAAARELAACEGILAGISSGAALCAATRLAMLEENKNKNIVVVFPDGGERYLSCGLFAE